MLTAWHTSAAVRSAYSEMVAAQRHRKQTRLSSNIIDLTDSHIIARERVFWAELVFHEAVNAALRAQMLSNSASSTA